MNEKWMSELLQRLDRIADALESLAARLPVAAGRGAEDRPEEPPDVRPERAVSPGPEGNGEADAVPGPITLVPEPLARFLESRGIRVRRVPPPTPADPVLDRTAVQLATRYPQLREILARIKNTMQTGGTWYQKLAGRPAEEIGACCQFCHQLHQLAFLTEYRYYRSPRCLIEARTSSDPLAQNFFSGQWLERYVRCEVQAVAGADGPGLALLANSQVVLPNHADFELDLLVAFDGRVFWIEAKSGQYQQYLRKYSEVARMLGLGRDQAIVVLAEAAPAVCEGLTSLFGMTVCQAPDFSRVFRELTAGRRLRVAG
jgi:hypothetical protein